MKYRTDSPNCEGQMTYLQVSFKVQDTVLKSVALTSDTSLKLWYLNAKSPATDIIELDSISNGYTLKW